MIWSRSSGGGVAVMGIYILFADIASNSLFTKHVIFCNDVVVIVSGERNRETNDVCLCGYGD